MGGGDLNLKKSWHPSTLRNIERVWKAEQKHEVEKQKIEQLQKELAEERAREEIQAFAEDQGVVKKREERLDWMYQGPAAMVNREEYLLGRKIDKTLELLEQQESGTEPKKDEFDIGSTMFSSQDLSGTATVDLANKIREDPLFSIMKKEKEQKKNLLSNPVKMKQLQQMLQQSLGKEKKKKSKKSKKHSDNNVEERHHRKHKKEKHHKKNSYDSDSNDSEKVSKRKQKSKHISSHEDKYHRRRSPNDFSNEYHESSSSKKKEYSHSSRNYGKDTNNSFVRHSSQENYSRKSHNYNQSSDSRSKRKLDDEERACHLKDEERERRLREMQENAKWRDQQRERNVKRYKEEAEKEDNVKKVDASDFIKPMLSQAAGKGSLENRVRQKVFSIQRSSADMDKHFARR